MEHWWSVYTNKSFFICECVKMQREKWRPSIEKNFRYTSAYHDKSHGTKAQIGIVMLQVFGILQSHMLQSFTPKLQLQNELSFKES